MFGLSRLGCPRLRLTDDDDDSRPAQMIPIALMIPARVWSTFDNIFYFSAAGRGGSSNWRCSRTKRDLTSRPGISALIISVEFQSFYLSLSSWSVNLSGVFTRHGRADSRVSQWGPGVLVVVFSASFSLTGTFLPVGLISSIELKDIIIPGRIKKVLKVEFLSSRGLVNRLT